MPIVGIFYGKLLDLPSVKYKENEQSQRHRNTRKVSLAESPLITYTTPMAIGIEVFIDEDVGKGPVTAADEEAARRVRSGT